MKKLRDITLVVFVAVLLLGLDTRAHASCDSPANSIEAENCLPGSPSSAWDCGNSGDLSIQGFSTDISFNVGGTAQFKIKTDAANYGIDIYRLGYYGGMGARKVA